MNIQKVSWVSLPKGSSSIPEERLTVEDTADPRCKQVTLLMNNDDHFKEVDLTIGHGSFEIVIYPSNMGTHIRINKGSIVPENEQGRDEGKVRMQELEKEDFVLVFAVNGKLISTYDDYMAAKSEDPKKMTMMLCNSDLMFYAKRIDHMSQ